MKKEMIPVLKNAINVKKRRQQLPMPSDIEDYVFSTDTPAVFEKAQDNFVLSQSQSISHLSGKYERYYFDDERKIIVKDLVNIGVDGRVIIRSLNGIFRAIGTYFNNTTLAINVFAVNDDEAFFSQLLAYTGRFGSDEIECLFAVATTLDSRHIPTGRIEVLIPSDTFGVLPEYIKIESQAFFKLNYKYPALYKILQTRQVHSLGKISWE
ncbi:hypothetical protein P1X15_11470 [Runella sp. MFBS21]|uniref:hypothetical protein n=1 Tax=Runella sp. MFBS21 TaxID=3034018 RepID=UPI0023F9AC49|nr:hypothetical protein [Runella sp. MFBS21]MDF7818221.1 hypothetical protein [Runella sp. MFBS21]